MEATTTERERDVLAGHAAALAVPAVRYALGRRTYAVGEVARVVRGLHAMRLLSANDRKAIRDDIDAQDARDALGDECDAQEWRELREALS